jgi:hypothetical protein
MAIRVKGKREVTIIEDGDGIADVFGFKAHPQKKDSLVYGIGRMFFRDWCRLDDNETFIERLEERDYEVDLSEILGRRFSNGVTGFQVLQVLAECTDLARLGQLNNIYGQKWNDLE